MINDYHNSLAIFSSDIDQLDGFISKAISSGKFSGSLTFSNFFPCPEIANRYTWRLENWGSCCEPFNIIYTRDYDEFIEYSFDTVGNSPIGFFEQISRLYPKLEFHLRFNNATGEIFGNAIIHKGVVVYNDTSEIDTPIYNVKSLCLRNMIEQADTVINNLKKLKELLPHDKFICFLHYNYMSEEMREILEAHFIEDFNLANAYDPAKATADFFNSLDDED